MRIAARLGRAAAALASHAMIAAVLSLGAAGWAVRDWPPPDLGRARASAELVTSASGEVLWGFQAPDGRWRFPVRREAVDPAYIDLLIATEDRRFASHSGIDVVALARAGWQALRHGRAKSGASTLTMQVARLLRPGPRDLASKLGEMIDAVRLERQLGKDAILELYLALAPFGGNLEGVRAASLVYLGKEPRRLLPAEAALLVAIPQAPEARRPDRHPAASRVARDRILASAASSGRLSAAAVRTATAAALPTVPLSLTRHAAHLATRLRAGMPDEAARVATLVDAGLQAHVEEVASSAVRTMGEEVSVAAIVIRNRDAAVTAYLGGVDPRSEARKGFVDMVQAVRSPGSALKPLIYAIAFETLAVHPETIITDQPVNFDGYRPDNADGQFAGDLSVRQALIRSRNTTAVMLLDRIGLPAFLSRFRSAGRPLQLPGSDSGAGLAVALGGVGVSLEQLTWFYTALAGDGRLRTLRFRASDEPGQVGQLIAPAAARATADILGDVPPPPGFARQRAIDGGRRIGFKTGTSYGFRDAWAVGFDGLHTVGVWVGRADGAAHLGAYGATAAAPILLRIFDRLPVPPTDVSPPRQDAALASARTLPGRLQRFQALGTDGATRPLEITFPRSGAELQADRTGRPVVTLPLTLAGGRPPFAWVLNGEAQPSSDLTIYRWPVAGRGQQEIVVTDAAGAVARSSFWLR